MATTRSSRKTDRATARGTSRDGDRALDPGEVLDYREVLETFADAVVAADDGNRIVYVNQAAERLLGWGAGELIGRPLTTIQPVRLRATHTAAFERYMATGVGRLIGTPVRVPALRRDGGEVDIELVISGTHVEGRRMVVASLRDLSDRVELERQLNVVRYLRATTFASAKLSSLLDVDEVVQSVVNTLVDDFDAALARIWTQDPAAGTLEPRASACLSAQTGHRSHDEAGVADDRYSIDAVARTRRPFIKNGLLGDAHFDQEWVIREGISAVAAYPLIVAGELSGVMVAFTRHQLLDEVVEVLANFAAIVTASLHDVDLLAREQRARRRAEESEERFRVLVDGVQGYAIFMHDPAGMIVSWNSGAERVLGYPADEVVGTHFERFYPPDEVAAGKSRRDLQLALHEGRFEDEAWRVRRDGSRFWASVLITPLRDEHGGLRGYAKIIRDITDRKRAEERLRFLANASTVLSSSLDYEQTLRQLAELAVPDLADWCVVHMTTDGGEIEQLALAHADPARVELARDLHRRYPPDPSALHGVANVIRTGRPEFAGEIRSELLEAVARDAEHLDLIRQLGLRSYMIVPLSARGRTFGTISLVSAESGLTYRPEDLHVAEELAGKAATAVDNARLYREAREAVVLRDDFLSLASHELRTPITILHAYTQSLNRAIAKGMAAGGTVAGDGPATVSLDRARLTGSVEAMNHAIGRLVRLIEDLLDVSRLQRGTLQLTRGPVNLSALVDRAVDAFRVQQQEGRISPGLTLRLEHDAARPVSGEWDADRLDQVITNLIENATKYSGPDGQVTVSLWVDGGQGGPAADGSPAAHLSVRDNGIGIPPGQLESIFEPYSRGSNASVRNYPGFGMGLAVARHIVERLGGRIWVESGGDDQGSTFHIVLPGAWLADEE